MDRKEELAIEIEYHNNRYYNQDLPEISDFEYDKLVKELKTLDPNHAILSDLGRAVWGQKVPHTLPMGSLNKGHTDSEVLALNGEMVAMPKIDGLSMTVTYIDGKLQSAATRGDGFEGEDVTENARTISNLPQTLTGVKIHRIEVRGEVYVDRTWFAKNMATQFKNPRNYAAGSLKQKDPKVTATRNLSFVTYRILFPIEDKSSSSGFTDDTTSSLSKSDELDLLRNYGFEVPAYEKIKCEGYQIQQKISWFTNARPNFHFDVDGIVFWLNDRKDFHSRGFSGVTPNGAIAYKFNTEKASTRVKDIEWNTSRTGRMVPVMIVWPVELAGTTVQRCTLNNFEFLKKADVAIGDEVEIEKANEIIPKLVSVLDRPLTRVEKIPTHCTTCNFPLVRKGVDLVCENLQCGAQILSKMLHFIRALKIEGFSGGSVQKLIDSKLLESKSLFEIDITDLQLAGFGPRQSSQFVKQVKAIEVTPAEFLAALGISGIGLSTWEKALEVVEFDKFADGQIDAMELATLASTVGSTTARKIAEGIKSNEEFIKETLPYLKIVETKSTFQPNPTCSNPSKSMKGKYFCITGTLRQVRNYYVTEIENRGGKVIGVSSKLDYLVCGVDPGSKLKKAKSLNIPIISEDDLCKMF